MALQQFVIDIAFFETNTVIDTDFDVQKKAYNHLIEAHEVQLYDLLGKELFKRLQEDILPTPTGALEEEFVDLLKPFMVKATEINLVPFLNSPVTAKGTQERDGQNSKSAQESVSASQVNNIRAKQEFYAEKVREFLHENRTEFPEYHCGDGGNNFYSPIHFH